MDKTSFGDFLIYAIDSDEAHLKFIGWVVVIPLMSLMLLTTPIWIVPVAIYEWRKWKKENKLHDDTTINWGENNESKTKM